MGADGFWDHQELAKPVIAEMKVLKAVTDPVVQILKDIDDVKALHQLGEEAGDASSIEEADRQLAELERRGQQIELQSLLDGKNDPLNCFVTIQSGAGGTEAQDWAEMLARMYLYFLQRRGWDVSEIDRQHGEQAGIKRSMLNAKSEF